MVLRNANADSLIVEEGWECYLITNQILGKLGWATSRKLGSGWHLSIRDFFPLFLLAEKQYIPIVLWSAVRQKKYWASGRYPIVLSFRGFWITVASWILSNTFLVLWQKFKVPNLTKKMWLPDIFATLQQVNTGWIWYFSSFAEKK